MKMGKKRKQKNNKREQQIAQELEAIANEYNLQIDQESIVDVTDNKSSSANAESPHKIKQKREYNNEKTLTYESSIKPLLKPHGFQIGYCTVPGCNCSKKKKDCKFSNGVNLHEMKCKKCKHGILNHEILTDDSSSMEISLTNTEIEAKLNYTIHTTFVLLLRVSCVLYESRNWRETILSAFLAYIKENSAKNEASLEIQPLLHKLENMLQGSTYSRDELRVHVAILLDKMYFCEYYNHLLQHGRKSRQLYIVPNPTKYFQLLHDLKPLQFTPNELKLPDDDYNNNKDIELYQLMKLRHQETILLFADNQIGTNGEMDQAISQSLNTNKKTIFFNNNRKKRKKIIQQQKQMEEEIALNHVKLPSYTLLQLWRDNCRDWLCHLYAYATPTNHALDVMKEYEPLIEIGAGTGYWSSLLKSEAYDITPPTTSPNEFHGKVPTFTTVSQGGPEILSKTTKNLFLCYPPPLNDMAYQCLRYFKGKFVLYVGEWQGNTANSKFEDVLERHFNLIKVVSLPNWSNTFYNLSIWERKSTEREGLCMFSCHACGDTKTKGDKMFKRCRLCRNRIYCSEECMLKDKNEHDSYHCQRFICLKNGMSFHSRTMFENL